MPVTSAGLLSMSFRYICLPGNPYAGSRDVCGAAAAYLHTNLWQPPPEEEDVVDPAEDAGPDPGNCQPPPPPSPSCHCLPPRVWTSPLSSCQVGKKVCSRRSAPSMKVGSQAWKKSVGWPMLRSLAHAGAAISSMLPIGGSTASGPAASPAASLKSYPKSISNRRLRLPAGLQCGAPIGAKRKTRSRM